MRRQHHATQPTRDSCRMEPMPQIHHFSQANPVSRGEADVPALLRRVADTIESLGVVCVQDVTFENDVTADGLWPSMTVYFHYGTLGEPCGCGACASGTPDPSSN